MFTFGPSPGSDKPILIRAPPGAGCPGPNFDPGALLHGALGPAPRRRSSADSHGAEKEAHGHGGGGEGVDDQQTVAASDGASDVDLGGHSLSDLSKMVEAGVSSVERTISVLTVLSERLETAERDMHACGCFEPSHVESVARRRQAIDAAVERAWDMVRDKIHPIIKEASDTLHKHVQRREFFKQHPEHRTALEEANVFSGVIDMRLESRVVERYKRKMNTYLTRTLGDMFICLKNEPGDGDGGGGGGGGGGLRALSSSARDKRRRARHRARSLPHQRGRSRG